MEWLIIVLIVMILIGGFIDEMIHFEERESLRRAYKGTQKFNPPTPPTPPKNKIKENL